MFYWNYQFFKGSLCNLMVPTELLLSGASAYSVLVVKVTTLWLPHASSSFLTLFLPPLCNDFLVRPPQHFQPHDRKGSVTRSIRGFGYAMSNLEAAG